MPVRWPERMHQSMTRKRLVILYSGRVQGVGFRYTARSIAAGYNVTGTVKNLADGRVELVAEGERDELEAFRKAIAESDLGGLIRQADASWTEPDESFVGFRIVG